jgi:hypothetical protein
MRNQSKFNQDIMRTKNLSFLGLSSFMALIVLLMASCGTGPKDQKANEEAADTINQELTLTPEAKNMLYELPTPFEVTQMLQDAKAGYIFDITNPIDNVGKYVTERSKAVNLGIYSADLAYSATYNQIDNTNQFLRCTNQLADALGIAGVYHPDLVEQVKSFANDKDSLVALVSDIFVATNDFLSKNNRNQVAVYIATGAFIEGLYLATSLNAFAEDNTQIATVILDQTGNYDKLVTVLELYKDDAAMKPVVEEILKLKPLFTDFGLEKGKQQDAEQANAMNELVESVRNTFIQ